VKTISHKAIGYKQGKKRIWLEGDVLLHHGFSAGKRITRELSQDKIVITLDPGGHHVVHGKETSGRSRPIIDVFNQSLDEIFAEVLAIEIRFEDQQITICPSDVDARVSRREAAMYHKRYHHESLAVASAYTGAGVFDHAIHQGLSDVQIPSNSTAVVEMDGEYMATLRGNMERSKCSPVYFESPMEYVESQHLHAIECDIAMVSLPCTGHSAQGRTASGLAFGEAHDAAGAQVFYALRFIQDLNPAIALFENVPAYLNSASYHILTSVLTTLGYQLQTRVFSGAEFGALENRKRMILVAISRGLASRISFSLDEVKNSLPRPDTLSEILEPISDDDPRWKPYRGMKEKEQRDIKRGRGFRMRWHDPGQTSCIGTITRGYWRGRGYEPMVLHPADPAHREGVLDDSRARLLTPLEHARAKTIPFSLVAGEEREDRQHEMLGQAGIWQWFYEIARALGQALGTARRRSDRSCTVAQPDLL
jgi:DNA (cytosine-5)-methyltransferase 1